MDVRKGVRRSVLAASPDLRRAASTSSPVNTGRPAAAASPLGQAWQPIGPAQVSTESYGLVTGRVSSIAVDSADATGNTVFVGTTGGGVWKSTNAAAIPGAVSFVPLTDNLPAFSDGSLPSLSIGAISVQPGGTGVVLAGTGDPNDALDSYYGSGLLRSVDGGLTWSLIQRSSDLSLNALTDFYFIGGAFAGFAWSTQSPNLVVAAVSESLEGALVDANQLQAGGGMSRNILGLYYSTDAGQTWLLATITDGPGQVVQSGLVPMTENGNAATAVVWNPLRNRFYAAIRFHGYYESLDGITWTRLSNQPGIAMTTAECPARPNQVGSPACPVFRGALAVQASTGDLFALTVDANLLNQGLWQDVCSKASGSCAVSAVTFGKQLPSVALEDGGGRISLGDYNSWLAAVPSSGDTLLFAGTTDIFRCGLAAGCVWRNATNTGTCAAAKVAPFQHAVDATFASTLDLMYFGNDSGLWRSTDNINQTQQPCLADDANHFQNLNSGIGSLAEVQALAQDPTHSGTLMAGLGVNGTAASASVNQTVWAQVLDGYGSYVAIDPENSQNWYAQSGAGVGIDWCTLGPSCTAAGFGVPAIGSAQVGVEEAYSSPLPAPFILDPGNSTALILGTCHVWRGPADGVSWSEANLLGDLYPAEGPDCAGNAFIQSLTATGAPSGQGASGELIYAGMQGLGITGLQPYAGHLFRATVSTAAPIPTRWTDLWLSPVVNGLQGFNPQQFSISSITTDPHDSTGQTIYVTIAGFSTFPYPTGLVYASTNGGTSWTNITSNLPDAPPNSMVVDPNDANTVYIALDTGVYVTTGIANCSTQNCWSLYGSGLPNSPVTQLVVYNNAGTSLLRAATYGRGIWQIPLITAAVTATTATVAPVSLTFAQQSVQTRSPSQTIAVANTGTIPLAIKRVEIDGDFAATNNCGASVAVGSSCLIAVVFAPTKTGNRPGLATIYANVANGQLTIPLSGMGVSGAALVLLPTSMDFGSQPIGVATTSPQNLTLSNTGVVAINLDVPTVTGDFAIVADTCSASLAPNFGCTVAIAFTPTASGERTGNFSITDSVDTQTATLSGIGLSSATDTVSPTSLSFAGQIDGTASAAKVITLTNSGDLPLNSINVTVTGDFHAANGCGNSLIGHASCSVAVTYVPTGVGAESGTLTVVDMYGRPQALPLTGIGVAPAGISALPTSINFGDWGVAGTSSVQTVTLTDNGGVPLNALTFTVIGDFAIVGNSCSSTLAAGLSCAVQVVFSPAQSGPASGSLSVGSSSLGKPFQIALDGSGLGFVFQPSGASSATVTGGQTANYLLQIIPSNQSIGTLELTCAGAPQGSICTIHPAVAQISSGVTTSVAVTIATVGATASHTSSLHRSPILFCAVFFPAGLFLLPWCRKRKLTLAAIAFMAVFPLGCGVSASVGSSGPPSNGGPVTTPSATYNPVITATGPGINESVKLTLVVE